MFKWNKKGLIFSVNNQHPWMYSHAQIPFVLEFDDFIRVYFATREKYDGNMSRAFGGFVDLDKNDLKKVLRISDKPLMDLGGIGEFDEFGSMPTSVIRHGGEYYLYYTGWTRGYSTPYDWEIGLAKSSDGEQFKKIGKGPLIGPTIDEPYLNAAPIVYKFSEENWHMFYLSGVKWLKGAEKPESQYVLKHANSKDGVNWIRNATPIIPTKVKDESQTSAALLEFGGKYHMFFCYRESLDFRTDRNKAYRMGYASSEDLITWTRDDSKVGIGVSDEGWDSQMIEYPHISKINGKYIMFYCGNHFGKDGFGYAELEEIINHE